MSPRWLAATRIVAVACALVAAIAIGYSHAADNSVLFPSASIDSTCTVQLYWYSPGSGDTAIPPLSDPPVAWLESPPSTAWAAAARIASPPDSAVLYAIDVQLKCPAECGAISFGLRHDTGAPGSAIGPIDVRLPVIVSANTYRLHLNSPVLLRAYESLFACIYWSASDRFALGEAEASPGSAFVAFLEGYEVPVWQLWPDYSLSISGVFATPLDCGAVHASQGDSVALWRHALDSPDSALLQSVEASARHASDTPPLGRDIKYAWNDGIGNRLTDLNVPVARATSLQWIAIDSPGGGLKDRSPISATLQNWSDSILQIAIMAQTAWSEGASHSGTLPTIEPTDPNFQLLPRSDVAVSFMATVEDGAHGFVIVSIEASDLSPLQARTARLTDSLPVGITGVDHHGRQPSSVAPWPNPCRGVLHVPSGNSLVLMNLLGRRVAEYRSQATSADATWDLGALGLPAGTYWLRVQDRQGTRFHKLTLLE